MGDGMAVIPENRRAFGLKEYAQMIGVSYDVIKLAARIGTLRTVKVGDRRLVPLTEAERVERSGLSTKAEE
jgi:hypothetical protein